MTLLTLPAGDRSNGIDTDIVENLASTNNSAGTILYITNFTSARRVGLIKFDLSGIPAGAIINSAVLTLYGNGLGQNNTAIFIHRILPANSSWTEAGAVWNFAVGTTRWAGDAAANGGSDAGCSVSGTDYSATVMGTVTWNITSGQAHDISLDLTEFSLMLANNCGMIIKRTDAVSTQIQIPTSDSTNAALRPKLVVDYTESGGALPGVTRRKTLISRWPGKLF